MNQLLNARSHFSLGTSILSPKSIVLGAKKQGYDTVALCDNNTVSGMTDFVSSAAAEGLKAIVGVTLTVVDDPLLKSKKEPNPSFQVKVFAKNEAGMKDIFKLLSLANSEQQFYYNPRLGWQQVIDAMSHCNLVLTTGDFFSIASSTKAEALLQELVDAVGNSDVYAEIIPVDQPYYSKVNVEASRLAQQFQLGTLLSRPVLYEHGSDKERDIMSYICGNGKATNPRRNIPATRDFHFLDPNYLESHSESLFGESFVNLAKDDMSEFCDKLQYTWEKQSMCLPEMAENEFEALVKACREGWSKRLSHSVLGYKPDSSMMQEYRQRLATELKVLKKMGFENYFLLVAQVVNWSKENKIYVGPARGSAAGSLVAYLMGITDVDPIRFNLIFERFLNPDRLDYPDIDLDFMSSRRQEVIDMLVETYGEDRVAGISNYGMLGSSSAMRDVARIHELEPMEYASSKYVPTEHGSPVTLEEAVVQVPEIEKYALANPELWKTSCKLQGVMRSLGRHAAGVVVAGEPLVTRSVVERRKGESVINWDKRIVEDWGLIKLDVLGLSTLDVIRIALDHVQERHKKNLNLLEVPLDDEKVLDLFAKGATRGVFQFEGSNARRLLKEIAEGGELTFDDIVAVNALNRPGPLDAGLTDRYVRIRQGREKPHYPHPLTEAALKKTGGVMVYQEQVMQIARDLCNFTMAEADTLRKAIGKKSAELMASMGEKFIKGAAANGMNEVSAEMLWSDILGFAAYSFNLSHAVSYSIISYQAAYLKAHYPAEFYASSLTVLKEDKLKGIAKDAASDNIHVVPPDINYSSSRFEIGYDEVREQHILYTPFDKVKNLSAKTTEAILAARKGNGAFASKEDFLKVVDKRRCNKRAQENLERVGAFAAITPGDIPARHPDRLRAQKELVPGLIIDEIAINRKMVINDVKEPLSELLEEIENNDGEHPRPTYGKRPQFMFLTDCPNFSEVKDGKMLSGKGSNYLREALKEAGLKPSNGYYASLVKRPKEDKQLTNEEVNTYSPYLEREIDILKPGIIVAAGGGVARQLVPDVKGGWEEMCGQVHYDPVRDCNIVIAPNPMMCFPRPEVQDHLNSVMIEVAEMIEG